MKKVIAAQNGAGVITLDANRFSQIGEDYAKAREYDRIVASLDRVSISGLIDPYDRVLFLIEFWRQNQPANDCNRAFMRLVGGNGDEN